ncbi:polysaccharide biosynthesis C-terminal domain-containing protein [Acinetobacter baumannii]|uniref:polysaccharide biosynthesis C-terminal domain-containing protein n=1 Tax=Acinetobacter baumannii TaxID=470 RepID=UPI00233F04DF|nr:polysaccharide biosynthesis C-terminal domain-containing protein [Acinetobacter baumannii]MDC4265226.1 polysaccharide biosynthesis C-terminal domain-containing protein [Acinetobacter baumannii]MDH2569130.1 polysaccharide biosynthesis C-terminal domain-containing protein [Acinetobacter baumannii]
MLSLLNKAKFLLSGNILFAFSQWLILIFISHFSDNEAVGAYTYALALVTPVFMLTNLQLRPVVVAEFNLNSNFNYKSYFALRFYSIFLAILVSFLLSFLSTSNVWKVVLLLGCIKALEAISDIIYAYYNAQGKTKLISLSLTVKSLSLILIFGSLLYFYNLLNIGLIGIILIYVLTLLLIDFRNIGLNKKYFYLNIVDFKNIIILALPLGISVMLVALQSNIPRFFLEKFFNLESVGVFSVFYYFIIVGGIVINSICQFISPKFSILFKENKMHELNKLTIQAWGMATFLGISGLIVSITLGEFFVNILYGSHYLVWIDILNIIMFAGLFTYLSVVNGYLMTSLGLIKIQLPLFLFLTIFTLVLCWTLIPAYGLLGAAWATVASSAAQFILSTLILYMNMVRKVDA